MYRDKRLAGFDAAAVVEVIEHLDAPRPAQLRAGRLRVRTADDGRPDDPEPRVQRQVRSASGGRVPPPRPPLRVDARGVRGVGRRVAAETGTACASCRSGRKTRARRADPDGGVRRRMSRALEIPELSLVLLVGASGSGKSTFARTHFLPTEVLSSDFCRGLVSDDENDQDATGDAFDLLHYIAAKRMARGRLTVVDATNVQPRGPPPPRQPRTGVPLPSGRDRLRPLRAAVPGPKPRPPGPRLRPACDPQPAAAAQARRCVGSSAKASGRSTSSTRPRRSRPPRSSASRSGTTRRPSTARSTSSATCTAAPRARAAAGAARLRGRRGARGRVPGRRSRLRASRGADGGLRRRPRRPRAAHPRQPANRAEHGRARLGARVPGNHDMKFVRELRGRDVQITHGLDRSPRASSTRSRRTAARRHATRRSASSTGW